MRQGNTVSLVLPSMWGEHSCNYNVADCTVHKILTQTLPRVFVFLVRSTGLSSNNSQKVEVIEGGEQFN